MAGNVKVCCRFRPFSEREISVNAKQNYRATETEVQMKNIREKKLDDFRYTFDAVFKEEASQSEIFEKTAAPMIKDMLAGYNTTVFAYGQTGSGKTYTMMGEPTSEKNKGIIPRFLEGIFQAIEEADDSIRFTMKLSYVEIYNESIRDLLDPTRTNLKIRETDKTVWIQDISEHFVLSNEQVLDLLQQGGENRAMATTSMNDTSSRSHSVFMVSLGQLNSITGSRVGSKLMLVDLAGSEKVRKTQAAGQTLKEAQHINKSLSALGNVINALVINGPHIPYRDSKLTRILTESLGGNSKTCLIMACSPAHTEHEETLSTCRFGHRAKNIKNKPKINAEKSVKEYKLLLEAALKKIAEQEREIAKLEKAIKSLRKNPSGSAAAPSSSSSSSSSSLSDQEEKMELEDLEVMVIGMEKLTLENATLRKEIAAAASEIEAAREVAEQMRTQAVAKVGDEKKREGDVDALQQQLLQAQQQLQEEKERNSLQLAEAQQEAALLLSQLNDDRVQHRLELQAATQEQNTDNDDLNTDNDD
eukprot:CAMPEP_0175160044 /NCGR_PEP_ID=MMETSP0087-20121206/23779_1 /TAXON_ID=136419 /ORGANISM="Unknown Unknown, Strain D1" /LENGTH=530 /DNA_ID=CAMNT_0016448201 /DNA_START=20 /DNA_END=1609 /DNA_ORIENTATION=-